jgi:DNA-binding transcriptional ArsR family regulator
MATGAPRIADEGACMMVPRIDEIGRLVGDPSRAAMLDALMDGRAWTGRELAGAAHVMPSTASEHLARLVDGALLDVVAQGRHRYYRIASPEIAQALEALVVLAPVAQRPSSMKVQISSEVRRARTCYDHLAGELGVALADALVRTNRIVLDAAGASITAEGEQFFAARGITLEPGSRPACKSCLDWSERRFHIAGRLGAALAQHAFDAGWVTRKTGTRALTTTPRGIKEMRAVFNFDFAEDERLIVTEERTFLRRVM